MSYIGQRPVVGRYIKLDQISSGFNGSNTGFSMTAGSQAVFPGTARNLLLSLGGVIQEPDTDFTISGSTLTFTTPPVANTTFFGVIYGDMQATGTPSDGTVLPASIASSGHFKIPQLTVNEDGADVDFRVEGDTDANLLFVDASTDRIGISESSPQALLHLNAGASSAILLGNTTHGYKLRANVTSSNDYGLLIEDEDGVDLYRAVSSTGTSNANTHTFYTAGSERIRIDASGRLLKGTTSAITLANNPNTQIVGTSTSDSSLALIRQTTGGGEFVFAAGTSGSNISNGNGLGFIKFMGYHTNGYDEYARIQSYADGTNGDGDAPGRLEFATTADGASSPTERMRINSSGHVGIGNTSPDRKLEVQNDGDYAAKFSGGSGAGHTSIEIGQVATNGSAGFNATGGSMLFDIAGSEKMRLNTSGNLGIGTTSPNNPLHVHQSGSGATVIQVTNADTGSGATDGLQFGVNSSEQAFFHMREAAPILFTINGTERMRIDSSGRLLLGTTTEGEVNADDFTIATTANTGITIRSGTSNFGSIYFSDGTSGASEYRGIIAYSHSNEFLHFYTAAAERMRINSSGSLLIGATSSVNVASSGAGFLQVEVDSSGIPATFYSTVDASGPSGVIALGHARGSASGVLQNNDLLGQVRFAGGDGTDLQTQGAAINALVNGTPSSNNMPTDLIFFTNSGTASVSERMRITKAGKVGIGTSAPDANLEIYASNNTITDPLSANNRIRFRDNDSTGTNNQPMGTLEWYSNDSSRQGISAYITVQHDGSTGNGKFSFRTANGGTPAERLVIKADGKVGISSSPARMLAVSVPSTQGNVGCVEFANNKADNTAAIMFVSTLREPSSSESFLQCNKDQNNDGSGAAATFFIRTNGDCDSATNSYGGISDITLKENIVDAKSQWDDIKNIKIRNFNFKDNPSQKMLGVVAQEVETVSAGLVKDCPDENITSPGPEGTSTKSVKYSILYMKAIKALQEAMTRIETLEAEVAALKAA